MRKNILRIAALAAFVGILSLYVPGVMGAERPARFSIKRMIEKPYNFIASMLGFLPRINDGKDTNRDSSLTTDYVKRLKTSGGLQAARPSGGD